MKITYDPIKRAKTLEDRAIDFLEAKDVFAGRHFTFTDNRFDYGEIRHITVGYLGVRMVIVGWVQRGNDRHVFTMRKANEREIRQYSKRLEQV